MYTILMHPDKHLTKTAVSVIYQKENLVDKLKFIVPRIYGGLNMCDFKTTLMYTTPSGEDCAEVIQISDVAYKEGWMCGYVPVDSRLTELAGDVTLRLVFTNSDQILQSGSTTITVYATDGPEINTPGDGPSGDDSIHNGFEVVEF